MKRTIVLAAGLLVLGAVIYVGRLWAQQPGTAPPVAPRLQTRIALVNLTYVMKNYARNRTFDEEIKKAGQHFVEAEAKGRAKLEGLNKEIQDPATPAEKRDSLQKELRTAQREYEDNRAEADRSFKKMRAEQIRLLYLDVQDAARRYAVQHDFEMVLHFFDATTDKEYNTLPFVVTKAQQAFMPLWYSPSMDISAQVLADLNASVKSSATNTVPTNVGRTGG